MSHTAPPLALIAPNDSSSAYLRDIMAHILRVHPTRTETGLDDILRDTPKRGQDVERTAIVTVECANEESGFAI
jgi:hypothetical protein